MQSEMHRVVQHVTGKETATHTPTKRQPKRKHEYPKKQPRQWDREGGRQNETPRVVRMIVMHTMNHPMNASTDTTLGLEMKNAPVSPVLTKGPKHITAGRRHDRLEDPHASNRQHCEDHDHRYEDNRRSRRMRTRKPIESRRRKDRRRRPKPFRSSRYLTLVDHHLLAQTPTTSCQRISRPGPIGALTRFRAKNHYVTDSERLVEPLRLAALTIGPETATTFRSGCSWAARFVRLWRSLGVAQPLASL